MQEKDRQQSEIDARRHDLGCYTATVGRLEPDISMIDPGAFYASAAISLKRIADALDNTLPSDEIGNAAIVIHEFFIGPGVMDKAGLPLINHLAQNGFKLVRR